MLKHYYPRLKTVFLIARTKIAKEVERRIIRYHYHPLVLVIEMPVKGLEPFFNSITLSSFNNTAKLRYDARDQVLYIRTPAFDANTTQFDVVTKKLPYRWKPLPHYFYAQVKKQLNEQKGKKEVVTLRMNVSQLIGTYASM